MELPLAPEVAEVRRKLQTVLDSTLHDQPPPFTATESCGLCEQVGIWPIPLDADCRLQALALFASRVVPALSAIRPAAAENDEHFGHNFGRWLDGIAEGDQALARGSAVMAHLWGYADSRKLGPCIG